MKAILPHLLILLLLSSCTKAIMVVYGIKRPKVKTSVQIEKAIDKYGLGSLPNYSITYSGFLHHFDNRSSLNDLEFYAPNGNRLEILDSVLCSGKKEDLLYTFIESGVENDSLQLDSVFIHLRHLDGSIPLKLDSGKYVVVMYWATYAGKLNSSLNAQWNRAASSLDTSQIEAINVSLDIREFWDVQDVSSVME